MNAERARTSPLGTADFVRAALDISTQEGVDKLSMRKVAARLDVSPMAMYKHFSSKEALLVATLDEFIAEADVLPCEPMPWQPWFEHVARRMYAALSNAPSWLPWLGSLGVGPQAAAVSEAVINKLVGEGFSPSQALTAYYSMVQLIIGAACLQANLAGSNTGSSENGQELIATRARTYLASGSVNALAVAPALDRLLKADQIDLGLPLLLAALSSQLSTGS